MGETVLKKTKYNQDVATARHQYRRDQDALMLGARITENLKTQHTQQQQGFMQQFAARVVSPLVQNVLVPVLNLLQNTAAFLTRLAAPLAQPATMLKHVFAGLGGKAMAILQNAASQILTFFFGHKKENDKADEKHQRDRNDISMPDFFGKTAINQQNVEASTGKFLGG